MQLIQFRTSRPPWTKTGLLQTYRMYVHCSREWTEKEDGEKKSQKGKEENLLISLCSVPNRFGRLAGQATRYRLRRNGPTLICQNRSPHEWTWYVSFGTSTTDPFSTTLELLHVPNIFSYLKRRWRSESDRTKCIKRLSHKKFNTTNGLNGRVVTGTQVSLEFLQINR